MISELEKMINDLKSQLDVELISEDRTRFEQKRDEFFKKLKMTVNQLNEINSKLKDFLSSNIVTETIEDQLKNKVEQIRVRLLAIASKKQLTTTDSDEFRKCYNHLVSLNKYLCISGIDIQQVLSKAKDEILEKVAVLYRDVEAASSDTTIVAGSLIRMKFLAENLSMFETEINEQIDATLKNYKQKEGPMALLVLSTSLEKSEIGNRIISEHSYLSGQDWIKRRSKMQNQDNLEYVLSKLKEDDISTIVLTKRFNVFDETYKKILKRFLGSLDLKDKKEPDIEVLIRETKLLLMLFRGIVRLKRLFLNY
jgi:hypothetical protein